MPRYPLSTKERRILEAVDDPAMIPYHILYRLQKLKPEVFRADLALLEKLWRKLQK